MHIINAISERARNNLRGQLHKVAAIMTKNEGVPISRDEITIKEASYLMGYHFWKNYLEKRAMLDGICHIMRLND
ncbi:MAG: hypothetical protein PVI90_00295 [Desulfobacteraceae bacterium]|jgi:hypothetical protein